MKPKGEWAGPIGINSLNTPLTLAAKRSATFTTTKRLGNPEAAPAAPQPKSTSLLSQFCLSSPLITYSEIQVSTGTLLAGIKISLEMSPEMYLSFLTFAAKSA